MRWECLLVTFLKPRIILASNVFVLAYFGPDLYTQGLHKTWKLVPKIALELRSLKGAASVPKTMLRAVHYPSPETGCRWRCETRRPRFATQSSDAFILNACAHCLALQMIFFSSPPQGSDDFCKVVRKQLVTQFKCGNHTSCKEPRNTTRCSFSRGGEKKTRENQKRPDAFFCGEKKHLGKMT